MFLMTSGRRFVILARLLAVSVVLFLLYLNNTKSKKIIKKLEGLTFKDFPLFFKNFIANKLQSNFIGVTSNQIDLLYFVTRKNYVNFEYEVLLREQKPYATKLVQFAQKKGFKIVQLTYENKMKDDVATNAKVYQIKAKLPLQKVTPVVIEIYTTVFNATENTHFNLVF